MTTDLAQLEPASKADVIVHTPYYPKDKHNLLPYAISLYNLGYLEGIRQIEGSDGIPFVAQWYVSKLPSELTRCRLQFKKEADLSYELTLLNSEFITYLISVIKTFRENLKPESEGDNLLQLTSKEVVDFPQDFYKKLLRFEE